MTRSFDFDLFVIGGGSGGVRAARMAGQLGARVALAEGSELGGTCVNLGCIPKKLYSYAAGYAYAFVEAAGYGWQVDEPRFVWSELKANRAREIERLNGVYSRLLEAAGVTVVRGWARFADAHTVEVCGQRFRARHVLIASGGAAWMPELPGREHAVTSDAMFDLAELPRRLLVVGAGYIACELASIFNGLGSQVKLASRNTHILSGFDEGARDFLARSMSAAGVDMRYDTEVTAISDHQTALSAVFANGDRTEADVILFATGRRPNTMGLNLADAGVQADPVGRVIVDARGRTSVESVHAVGDVCSRQQLTPIATAEAMIVVDSLFGKKQRQLDYEYTPTAVFTHPSFATCGLTEAQARDQFGEVRTYSSEFRALRHALSNSAERVFMKLVVDQRSDRVIGLHMVGSDAAEVVQGFAVAMRMGATKADFDRTIGIHPTVAEEFVTMRMPDQR